MTAIRNFDLPDGISNKVTGTTSDSYDDALSWTVYGLSGKTIAIKNTHSSNALKYKILTYVYPGGTEFEEVSETSLSAGSSIKHTIGYPCARVIVQVKSSTAGNAATYQIEYTGNRFAGQSELKEAKEPIVYNKTLTNADTEYSVTLPDHTKKLTFQCRTADDIRFAFEPGKVATPTEPYITLKANSTYDEKDLDLVGKTLYLACSVAGKVVEILVYT